MQSYFIPPKRLTLWAAGLLAVTSTVLASAPILASTSPSTSSSPPASASSSQPPASLSDRTTQLWQEHQLAIILVGIALGLGFIGYEGVLWIRPLWLLKIPVADLPTPWKTIKVPMGILRSLIYRDRVLDAWVNRHWRTAQADFLNQKTVKERAIHISLPVELNEQLIEDLSGRELAKVFARKTAVLLITGEGGAGKTSLACQIALWGLDQQLCGHRLLPVLIETELDDEQKTLFERIRGAISSLTDQPELVTSDLVDSLLHRQRVLVIVDHLSEMSDTTRKQITPELADFPAKALVVTSRLDEQFGGISKAVLTPIRIEGGRLSRFMDSYLERQKKRDLFEDEDYFDACRRLSRMVGQRNITVLLARLYADQMIEQQQGAGGTLPDSVPELMLSYLNQLNRAIEPESKCDDLQVQQDAQRIAWECLEHTYRPTAIKQSRALDALNAHDSEEAQHRLHYLDTRLRLLQPEEPDKIRIVLDPLAEYLAALHLVEAYREDPEACWQQFLDSIESVLEPTHSSTTVIQGFLLAVRDCCLLKLREAKVPRQIPNLLAQKAGLDPEELRQIEEKRRIRLLISDLSAPELAYRIRAAKDLGNRGSAAATAVPNLLGMAENPNQAIEARQAATQALGNLGCCSETMRDRIAPRLMALLQQDSDELEVRRSVAEALGVMKAGKPELLSILENEAQPLPLRQGAARALSLMGASSGDAVPMLMVELREHQVTTQVKRIRVWQEALAPDLSLNLVEIPAGEFVMGSPPEEDGRDVYASTYPKTEGLDVETQHRVRVPSFYMSQSLITQAQWRAIATQPTINRDLNPDPAQFKGDNRPVESVSWYDAVEFCDRLSQLTGKVYRLPSEAEWEYACRAGTTTPFHFGETLNTAIANYDGTYTYGPGTVGTYRNTTTDVGCFGVVNAFGLADMHGNLWEWCLDHWHPSYDNAPTDGSAWTTDGDERYRLLRGGSWFSIPRFCRSAFRGRVFPGNLDNSYGFRVVCGSP